jgi:solute:Na+ symporter, SSS family
MLLWLVIAYLAVSIAIGLYGASKVHNAKDYVTAGRNLPFVVVLAMVFATWFGAETVLGISATFLKEGFRGLISDPLGASICLSIVRVDLCATSLPHESFDARRLLSHPLQPSN